MRSIVDYDKTRAAIIYDLLGVNKLKDATMMRLDQDKHPGVKLKKSKLDTLARKFFSIPSKYLGYYPNLSAQLKELENRDIEPGFAAVKRKGGGRDSITKAKRRRVGRPPKAVKPIASVASIPSILTFLTKRKGNE